MSLIKRTEGVVIRTLDYGESHKIVSAISRDAGVISFMAKGARKTESRFGAALELLTQSEFIYYDREGLKTLSQADIVEAYSALKRDYERLTAALRCARWLYRLLTEGSPEERIFDLFCALLAALSGEAGEPALYQLAFKLKSLVGLGVAPTFDRCAACGRAPAQACFSMEKGGLLCKQCTPASGGALLSINWGTARTLHMALKLPFSKLKRLHLSEGVEASGERLVEAFTAYHLRPPARASARARRSPRRG